MCPVGLEPPALGKKTIILDPKSVPDPKILNCGLRLSKWAIEIANIDNRWDSANEIT